MCARIEQSRVFMTTIATATTTKAKQTCEHNAIHTCEDLQFVESRRSESLLSA